MYYKYGLQAINPANLAQKGGDTRGQEARQR